MHARNALSAIQHGAEEFPSALRVKALESDVEVNVNRLRASNRGSVLSA